MLSNAQSLSPQPSFRFDRLTWVLVFLLALLTGITFSGVRSARFLDLDDDLYVTANPHVLGGLTSSNIGWAFQVNAGWWIPLTWLSLQLDATIAPPPAVQPGHPPQPPDATIFHLDNLFLHILAATFLFLALYRATRRPMASWILVALWAVHPLRVESVAWVTERKDVLSVAFGFLALYLYIVWREKGGRPRYAAICGALLLSLMAKITFVTLPALLVLLDIWPLRRIVSPRALWRSIVGKIPLFIIALTGMLIAFHAQSTDSSVVTNVALAPRVENALLSYVRYIVMQVDVHGLSVFYPYLGRPPAWEILSAILLLAAITALALWQRSRRPWLVVGWFWYLGTLVPLIGLIQIGDQAYADRFTYLSAIGLLLMVVWSFPTHLFHGQTAQAWLSASVAALLILFAALTAHQVTYWQDSITLFEHCIASTRSNYFLLGNLGTSYMHAGRPADAELAYRQSLAINPDQASPRFDLGMLYLMERRPADALPHLAAAASLKPNDAAAHNLYGAALAMTGNLDQAITQFSIAVRLNPNDPQSQRNLAQALAEYERRSSQNSPPASR